MKHKLRRALSLILFLGLVACGGGGGGGSTTGTSDVWDSAQWDSGKWAP